MRWTLLFAATSLALLGAACGSRALRGESILDGPTEDAAETGDASVFDARPDAVLPPDARSFAGVECGLAPAMTCKTPTSVCCIDNNADTCITPQTTCGGERMQCDGTEDCHSGEACCFLAGHGALCTPIPMCNGPDLVMCHPDGPATCANGLHCCSLGAGPAASPYGVCRSACPQ